MKLRRNKKGFTIVELVIVIAVIGILAAVLIPTFVNLNNKANRAADESLVKNLNTALAMQEQEIGDTKNNTLHDAVLDLENYGYLLPNLVTKSSDKLLWNQETNRFILEDGDKQGYPNVNFWRIQDDTNDADGYSIYAGLGFTATTVDVKVGFDAGYKTNITAVSYTRVPNGESDKQEVSIRTKGNMCVLTINAQNDHVDHYGYAKTTNVVAVNSENSYHEYGTSNELVVTKGKVVIEDTGVVFDLKPAEGSSSTNYDVTNAGGNVMGSDIPTVVPSTSFEINSLAQLESFRDATNSGERFVGKNVNLNVDIVLNRAWTPISNYTRNLGSELNSLAFGGIFDGKNHTITGLTNVGLNISEVNTGTNKSTPKNGSEVTYGFFASTSGATIKNIKFADVNITNEGFGELLGDSVAACVGFTMGESTIEGVKVLSGKIEGFDAAGGVLGRDKGSSIIIKNCSNAAEVFCFQGAAGIAGRIYATGASLFIDGCVNSGKVTSDYQNAPADIPNGYDACYAVGITDIRNHVHGNVMNCTNTGDIIRRKPATGNYKEGHIAQIVVDKDGDLTCTNNTENGTVTVLDA